MTAHPMTSTERDLPEDKLRERLLGIVAGPNPALTSRQRVAIRDAAAALASIRAERDAAVAAMIEEFAKIADDLTGYTGEGTEDRNDGFGMFARGVRFAKRAIADRIRAARAIAGEQKNG